eukprot:13851130-Ditylum_brightwellii.AAC.1
MSHYPWIIESRDNRLSCRTYLSESTIPNAGLGVFSGVDVKQNEKIGQAGIVIPLLDLIWHTDGKQETSLLITYPWNGEVAEKA